MTHISTKQVATFVRTPCIKFVAETASFFIFLAMIVGNSFAERQRLCDTTLRDDEVISVYWKAFGENITGRFADLGIGTSCIRTHRPAPLQMCIGIWIFGELLHIFLIMFHQELSYYIKLWVAMEPPLTIAPSPATLNALQSALMR